MDIRGYEKNKRVPA